MKLETERHGPTTIFTSGMLLWTSRRVPLYVFSYTTSWTFFGFWAAISLGMIEALGLLVAGLIGSMLISFRGASIPQANSKPTR